MMSFIIVIALCALTFAGKPREHYVLPLLPLLFVLVGRGGVDIWDLWAGDAIWRKRLSVVLGGHAVFFSVGVFVLWIKAFPEAPLSFSHALGEGEES